MECFKIRDRVTQQWCATSSNRTLWETEFGAKQAISYFVRITSGSMKEDFEAVPFQMVEQPIFD